MNTLKSKKGITLTTLAIIIAIMLILAGVAVYSGSDSIKLAQIAQFNSELKIIQMKVNEISEYNLTEQEQRNYGQDIAAQTNETKSKINTALGGMQANRL